MKKIAYAVLTILLCTGLSVSASIDSTPAAETPLPLQAVPASGASEALERFIFITIPGAFGDLDRAPVRFFHEKHTKTLESESCETCHPRKDNGTFEFTFPKQPDKRSADTLMNSYHDACIECHSERAADGREAGPVTCGECHVALPDYHKTEYLPVMPSYYDPLRDTRHGECLNCHREPAKAAEDAGELDWKKFRVKVSENYEAAWPKVGFDYQLHDKHDKALEQKCEECHYLSPQQKTKITAETREPKCKDWLQELDPAGSLTEQETAHLRCINCHLARKARGEKKTGPVTCSECHTDGVRPADAMKDVPRPECEQEEKILIRFDNETRMPGAAFNHKAHQLRTRGCQDCHHETMRACKECHTPAGTEEGNFITLAEAYHRETSAWSCIGCHAQEKQRPDCAGCHHQLPEGLSVTTACGTCHSGSLESLNRARKAPAPETLIPDVVEKEWEIKLLEKEYQPAKIKHLEIVQKLTERVNKSALATYFHTEDITLCAGCHHYSPLEKKKQVPQCSACHTARIETDHQRPDLLGAYHQQCLGCHKQMGGTEEKMPQTCDGCHEQKKQ